MCDAEADYTIVSGPHFAVEWFARFGREVYDLDRYGVEVQFDDLARVHPVYGGSGVGAIAVVRHAPGDAVRVAANLNVAFLTDTHRRANVGQLLADPGHDFAGTSTSGGGSSPAPLLDQTQVSRALPLVPSPGKVAGSRVALLDTGDAASAHDMIALTQGSVQVNQPAGDPNGHGTAVAEAIHAVAPRADVHAIQVLDAGATGTSAAIYQGLILALWDAAGFDVVNASLGVDAATTCGTALASTFSYLMGLRAVSGPGSPTLVAAAGNNRISLRAPATTIGATVVTAVDLAGNVAPYCSSLSVGNGVNLVSAPGATDTDSLGTFADGTPIFGTSFATGFVTGALVA